MAQPTSEVSQTTEEYYALWHPKRGYHSTEGWGTEVSLKNSDLYTSHRKENLEFYLEEYAERLEGFKLVKVTEIVTSSFHPMLVAALPPI